VTSENTAVTATKKATSTAANVVASTVPAVIETAELAVEVPSKVALSNKLVVTAGVVFGTALGVAGVIGYQKFQAKRAAKKANRVPDDASSLVEGAEKH
jgi:hypothetical protein